MARTYQKQLAAHQAELEEWLRQSKGAVYAPESIQTVRLQLTIAKVGNAIIEAIYAARY